MTTFLATFDRLFAIVTAALIATLLVATVATFAGVHVGAPTAPTAPTQVAMAVQPETPAAAVHTAAADRG